MGQIISIDYILVPLLEAILYIYSVAPFSDFFTYRLVPTGLLKLITHRTVLEKRNLYPAPVKPIPAGKTTPTGPPHSRSDDGFGTDYENPTTAMEGAPIGRNMPALPKHLRDAHGKPEVQLVAQRLLAREEYKPAGQQLNILAASWIQAMVHDWIGHFDGEETVTIGKEGGESLCPFAKSPFRFKNTKERPDGHFESERSNWWDAGFVYGNNKAQVDKARTFKGGKVIVSDVPHHLKENTDGTYVTGDNKNSWVGVALLQDIFLKEHNWVADQIAKENPSFDDQELFDKSRVVVSNLVAKIHTIDWTVELLKTRLLRIGMETNWYGLLKAWFNIPIMFLSKIKKPKADNQGTPFCLTEEFAAVYRLHSLSPPGMILGGAEGKEFVNLIDLVGDKGRAEMRKTTERPKEFMKSALSFPCGSLTPHNYPIAYRNIAPTDDEGRDLPKTEKIDLAALDLFRDRERGILKFNEFRRQLSLKPYNTWLELCGNKADARKLELIYGPGQAGIERLDLLVGDMYEKKTEGFALSETSFIVFLLMASRRLDADPFLNELYTEEYYSKFGLAHCEKVVGLYDLLERHYPDLAEDFKGENGKQKQSVFKPTLGPDAWTRAEKNGVVPKDLQAKWELTKKDNDAYFDELEEETKIYTQNLKANSTNPNDVFKPEWIYVVIAILLVIVPYWVQQNPDFESAKLTIRAIFPVEVNNAREFAFSNVRHTASSNRILHLFTNPLIYISQTYLLDQTPSLFGVSQVIFGAKYSFNAAGCYFLYLCSYSFLCDWYIGLFNLAYMHFFFWITPKFANWMTRISGGKSTNFTAFVVYLFCQSVQIIVGHLLIEDYYDWNIFQLFIVQQEITVMNIIRIINVYPSWIEKVEYWEPIFKECLDKGIYFKDCGM